MLGGLESVSGVGSIGTKAGGENIIPIEELSTVRWRGGIIVEGETKISGLTKSRSRKRSS